MLQVDVQQSAPVPLAARFECRPGELVALVGPSGSGKSTLLRTLLGFELAETGSVSYDGHSLDTLELLGEVDRRAQTAQEVLVPFATDPVERQVEELCLFIGEIDVHDGDGLHPEQPCSDKSPVAADYSPIEPGG